MTVASVSGRTESHTIPIGTIIGWHSSAPPAGWLLCSSQQVPIADYRELYNVITNNEAVFPFGANTNGSGGAGSTHFKLPDLNGGGYMPRSPSTTAPPLSANSNVGVTVAAATHTHTWTLGISLTDNTNTTNQTHNQSFVANLNDAGHNAHSATYTQGATTNNATLVNFGGTGNAGTALRAHGHNAPTSASGSFNHGTHPHGATQNTGGGGHTHAWTASGNSYTPASISSIVSHILTYYIIFAKPSSGVVT